MCAAMNNIQVIDVSIVPVLAALQTLDVSCTVRKRKQKQNNKKYLLKTIK